MYVRTHCHILDSSTSRHRQQAHVDGVHVDVGYQEVARKVFPYAHTRGMIKRVSRTLQITGTTMVRHSAICGCPRRSHYILRYGLSPELPLHLGSHPAASRRAGPCRQRDRRGPWLGTPATKRCGENCKMRRRHSAESRHILYCEKCPGERSPCWDVHAGSVPFDDEGEVAGGAHI